MEKIVSITHGGYEDYMPIFTMFIVKMFCNVLNINVKFVPVIQV